MKKDVSIARRAIIIPILAILAIVISIVVALALPDKGSIERHGFLRDIDYRSIGNVEGYTYTPVFNFPAVDTSRTTITYESGDESFRTATDTLISFRCSTNDGFSFQCPNDRFVHISVKNDNLLLRVN